MSSTYDGIEGEEGVSSEAEREVNGRKSAKLEAVDGIAADAETVRRVQPDLKVRAESLYNIGAFEFPDVKQTGKFLINLSTDTNRCHFFDVMFGEGKERPHFDTFTGRIVDHRGQLVDDRYSMIPMVLAANNAKLEGQSADQMRGTYREWAIQKHQNDLIDRVMSKIPKWDGVSRLKTSLPELFKTRDDRDADGFSLNEAVSEYFWLSLYCRVMMPGGNCEAPIVLALIGTQGCGKSAFGQRICQIIMEDQDADTVQLTFPAGLEFIRAITGTSIIAACGEMTGFNRASLQEIKNFIARKSDPLHWKYEGHFTQNRQWIVVMDGNSYDGLQRDDTGNRRFYPMFMDQLPDKNGQPQWSDKFVIDFTDFENTVWQLMAECREWLATNGGLSGYLGIVRSLIDRVMSFSAYEMQRGRGVIRDDSIDTFILEILKNCAKSFKKTKDGRWIIEIRKCDIILWYDTNIRSSTRPNWKHLDNKMTSLGGRAKSCAKGYAGWEFEGYYEIIDFERRIGMNVEDDDDADSTPFDLSRYDDPSWRPERQEMTGRNLSSKNNDGGF